MRLYWWRSLLSLFILSLVLFLVGIPKTYAGCDINGCSGFTSGEDCTVWKGKLGAQVSAATGIGTVTNNSQTCTFTVTLASYKAFLPLSGDLNYLYTQQLFDSRTATVAPGQTISLQVAVPNCLHQMDFFRGNGYTSFNPGNYQAVVADNMAADFPQNMPVCQQVTPTPVPVTPTPNPNAVQAPAAPAQQSYITPQPTMSPGGMPVYSPPQVQQLPQTPATGADMLSLLGLIPSGIAGLLLKKKLS